VANGVLQVALPVIFVWYRDRGKDLGVPGGQTGSITVIQMAESAIQLNVQFLFLVLDGVLLKLPTPEIGPPETR